LKPPPRKNQNQKKIQLDCSLKNLGFVCVLFFDAEKNKFPTQIWIQMVVKNGDESHGRKVKTSPKKTNPSNYKHHWVTWFRVLHHPFHGFLCKGAS